MNKTELVNAVAKQANLTQDQAKAAVNATLDSIADAIKAEDKVTLLGFGTFSISERAERKGINPRTKEEITIEAHEKIVFKASDNMDLYSRKHC